MNPQERFRRVQQLFLEARDLPPSEQESLLAKQCADNAALRQEVVGMLRADSERSGALDRPALGAEFNLLQFARSSGTTTEPPPSASVAETPARIGQYEIVRLIGQGGMGAVYEARQENPCRSVALKVMSGSSLSPRSLRRFRQEAQVLGRLQHPGIAQIFEAGVAEWGSGPQPFFAMELVVGQSLLDWARGRALGVRERIALLARICDAVHHAHQKGVIHRDLKPANILVVDGELDTSGDSGSSGGSQDAASAQPKILDFGVARLLDPDHAACTLDTSVGQIVGTVPYMSPEQAAGDSAAIDVRSDVYSLGVVAFELLAGRHPLGLDGELRGKALHDALRVVREQVPLRLGTIDRALRGEIETVVAKALEKEPARRYASASELAADLRRILRHEPIQARRAGAFHQMRKFARRNRALVAAATLAAAALATATVAALRLAALAERARTEERRLRETADDRAVDARREAYRGRLAAAASALRWHDVADARQQLEAAPEERRGWEWEHLRSRLDDSAQIATDCGASVMRLAFSPDGSELLVVSAVGSLQRRRATDLSLLARGVLPGDFRDRWASTLCVADDPRLLRVTTRTSAVAVDARSLNIVERATIGGALRAVSGDGRFAVVEVSGGAAPRRVQLRRLADGAMLVDRGPVAEGDVVAAFSPDGACVALAVQSSDGLCIHRTSDGAELLRRLALTTVGRLRFSRDGTRLAAATLDGVAHVLALDGSAPDVLLEHSSLQEGRLGVSALDFSPDASLVATASRDGAVRLWDLARARVIAVMHGHGSAPDDLIFAPDGTHVVTACGEDRSIRRWSATLRGEPFVLPTPQTVYAVAFSPDGRRLAAASLGGAKPVRIWRCDSGVELAAFGDGAASALAFDESGERLAIGRSSGDTSIVRSSDGAELARFGGPWWRTDVLRFSPDGRRLLRVANSGRLTEVAAEGGPVRNVFVQNLASKFHTLGTRLAISPREDLAALTAGTDLLLFDAGSFEARGRLAGHTGQVCAISFSPDGALLASAGTDRTVRIWDLRTKTTVAVLHGHTDAIYAAAFSPDGRRLATGGEDRVVAIWDTESWSSLLRLSGHSGFVYCLAWSPDGAALASGSADDTVRLWGTRPLRAWLETSGATATSGGE